MIKLSTKTLTLAALSATTLFAVSQAQAQPTKDKHDHDHGHSFQMTMHSRGQLGAQVITMSEELRQFFGAPKNAGMLVDRVLPDSPASKAGLKTGDVIVAVKGKSVGQVWDIFNALGDAQKNDKVGIEIIRSKKKRLLTATLDRDSTVHNMPFGSMGMGKGFGKHFDFDFSSPFAPGEFDVEKFPFRGDQALKEKIQRLEERLNRLEGKPSKSKKHKQSKPNKESFKTGPKSSKAPKI